MNRNWHYVWSNCTSALKIIEKQINEKGDIYEKYNCKVLNVNCKGQKTEGFELLLKSNVSYFSRLQYNFNSTFWN